MFSIIASTGRTATTFIARHLSSVDGLMGLHEGALDQKGIGKEVLPTVNLQNAQAFRDPASVDQIIAETRNSQIIEAAVDHQSAEHLIDVAYYNATIWPGILNARPNARMIGIVRRPEPFVRSATTLQGEDPLPVGWPDPAKPMTDRERFIAMGRIKPMRGSKDYKEWRNWSAVRRNIWLWFQTNSLLMNAKREHPNRVTLIHFELLQNDPTQFWAEISAGLGLTDVIEPPANVSAAARNRKPFSYQVPASRDWPLSEQQALQEASDKLYGVWDQLQ